MMRTWIVSAACGSGLHCAACRASGEFQRRVGGEEFSCPYGVGTLFAIPHFQSPLPAAPSLRAKARRLWSELRRWQQAGYALAPRAERRHRLRQCEACAHYAAQGNFGLGQCRLCGCTRAKLWLASAKCPHPDGARWG